MSGVVPSFEAYLETLGRLTGHVDPTASSPQGEEIKLAVQDLAGLSEIEVADLSAMIVEQPSLVPVLGLVVGLSQEKLKNALKDSFDTSGWVTLARTRPQEVVTWMDREFDLVRLLKVQLARQYELSDVLIARAGGRVTATRAGKSGRKVEDEIEAIAKGLGLPYQTRARFTGGNGRTAPCDLVLPNSDEAEIVVAAKGFDSTGSKLTDAVREIEEMSDVRLPRQFVMAVVDGIGWKSRKADLRRIHELWVDGRIDGLYTLATLDQFRDDLEYAAQLRHLI